jgi:hypothetical protein
MSNESLINRIQTILDLVQAEQASPRTLADSIRGNGRALEAMPYNFIKEIESLAMDLDIAQWHDEDGFAKRLPLVLIELPLEVAPLSPAMIWHQRVHRDPAHVWVRRQLIDVAASLSE